MDNIDYIKKYLICPYCGSSLIIKDKILCTNELCNRAYPIYKGIPIIINEDNSIFRINDFLLDKKTTLTLTKSKLKTIINNVLPSLSNNLSAKKDFKKIKTILDKRKFPKVLIIGGRIVTIGTDILLKSKDKLIIESDVSFGPRTQFILDCHNIPFADNTFDCVILQAVLEHVLDPYRCIDEVYRVLDENGIVYASTPFMQQVHMGKFDFTRFTHLGHRRLFRNFEELESGAFAGTGVALAWSIKYFFRSLSNRKLVINFFEVLTRLFFFWLKYIDHLTYSTRGTYDAASGFFFLEKKCNKQLSDRELLKLYKGVKK